MTIQEAINFVDIARMGYICDPHECGLEKGKDPCTAFHCDEMHDALAMAIDALERQIPQKPYKHEENYYVCPKCDCSVYRLDVAKLCNITYCWHCGQAIDWSDTEWQLLKL